MSTLNVLHFTSDRYIEEHVQRTAVAIETQGFTLITSGKKRESLTVSGKVACPAPPAVLSLHII